MNKPRIPRGVLYLSGLWALAAVLTFMDHSVGPDRDTYGLIGVAAGITVSVVVIKVLGKRGSTINTISNQIQSLSSGWLLVTFITGMGWFFTSAGYLRGRFDQSDLSPQEFAQYANNAGLAWVAYVACLGLVMMVAAPAVRYSLYGGRND